MNIVDVIRALGGFAWLAAIGLIVMAIARSSRNQNTRGINSMIRPLPVCMSILVALACPERVEGRAQATQCLFISLCYHGGIIISTTNWRNHEYC